MNKDDLVNDIGTIVSNKKRGVYSATEALEYIQEKIDRAESMERLKRDNWSCINRVREEVWEEIEDYRQSIDEDHEKLANLMHFASRVEKMIAEMNRQPVEKLLVMVFRDYYEYAESKAKGKWRGVYRLIADCFTFSLGGDDEIGVLLLKEDR